MAEQDNQEQPGGAEPWERDVINRLAFAALKEQRRARRWSIFFKFLLFTYLFLLLILYLPTELGEGRVKADRYTALVEVQGLISDATPANADSIVTGLRNAFEDKHTAGVILRINSPGGSPVQAGYVYDEIRRLRKLHPDTPIYAVASDLCASGGYYIASAADKIYADKASIVGSIGVLMNGFGFVEAMKKLGVERRLYTAGEHKGFLDPFLPSKPGDVAHIHKLLDGIHDQFIAAVKAGRGDRLKVDDQTFSGLVWTGEEAVGRGLVDGLGSASYVAREVIGAKDIVDFTSRPNYLERIAERLGTTMATAFTQAIGQGGLR